MKKVYLITGAGGWVGSRIVEILSKNNIDAVTKLKLFDLKFSVHVKQTIEKLAKDAKIKVEWVAGDITSFKSVSQALANVDVVIHSAAVVDHLDQVDKDLLWKVNVEGTNILIEACLNNNVQYCVYTSSTSVVGPNANGDPFRDGDETTPYLIKPATAYDKTKVKAEEKIRKANGKLLSNGKKFYTCALRPGGIYGRGDQLILQMYRSFNSIKCMVSPCSRDVCHTRINVDNVAWSHVLAAKKIQELKDKVGGKAYFLGDDTPDLPYMRLNHTFLKDFGFSLSREPFLPFWLFYIIAIISLVIRDICTFFNIPFKTTITPRTITAAVTPFTFSHRKFANDFDYSPLLSFEESLKQTKAHIRAYVKQKS